MPSSKRLMWGHSEQSEASSPNMTTNKLEDQTLKGLLYSVALGQAVSLMDTVSSLFVKLLSTSHNVRFPLFQYVVTYLMVCLVALTIKSREERKNKALGAAPGGTHSSRQMSNTRRKAGEKEVEEASSLSMQRTAATLASTPNHIQGDTEDEATDLISQVDDLNQEEGLGEGISDGSATLEAPELPQILDTTLSAAVVPSTPSPDSSRAAAIAFGCTSDVSTTTSAYSSSSSASSSSEGHGEDDLSAISPAWSAAPQAHEMALAPRSSVPRCFLPRRSASAEYLALATPSVWRERESRNTPTYTSPMNCCRDGESRCLRGAGGNRRRRLPASPLHGVTSTSMKIKHKAGGRNRSLSVNIERSKEETTVTQCSRNDSAVSAPPPLTATSLDTPCSHLEENEGGEKSTLSATFTRNQTGGEYVTTTPLRNLDHDDRYDLDPTPLYAAATDLESIDSPNESGSAKKDGCAEGDRPGWRNTMSSRWLSLKEQILGVFAVGSPAFYILTAFLDVQAGILTVLAFNYANLASSCLIDWISLLTAFLLSVKLMGEKPTKPRIAALLLGLAGSICILASDLTAPDKDIISTFSSDSLEPTLNITALIPPAPLPPQPTIPAPLLRTGGETDVSVSSSRAVAEYLRAHPSSAPIANAASITGVPTEKPTGGGGKVVSAPKRRQLFGDVMCLVAAILLGCVTVMMERSLIQGANTPQVLLRTCFPAFVICSIEFVLFEAKKLYELIMLPPLAWVYVLSAAVSMSGAYVLAPVVLKRSNSAFYNLSLLTSSGLAVALSAALLGDSFPLLYCGGLVSIFGSLILYQYR